MRNLARKKVAPLAYERCEFAATCLLEPFLLPHGFIRTDIKKTWVLKRKRARNCKKRNMLEIFYSFSTLKNRKILDTNIYLQTSSRFN
jgi:hypothetical protein